MTDGKYRETIGRTVEVTFTHKKIFDGGGEFAHVKIRLEPLPRGTGIQFVNDVKQASIPDNMIGGVEEGIREAAKTGVLNGGHVVDFSATLIDGAYHEVDSQLEHVQLGWTGCIVGWHAQSRAEAVAYLVARCTQKSGLSALGVP